MDEIVGLVLAPFRDVVEKSNTALSNAGEVQPILKASRSLLREGERCLGRIEPLCRRHFEEYGSNFVAAVKENDELTKARTRLNNLLWGFDDFLTREDFDGDVFAELQGLLRDVAPRIYDILLTMKLEPPPMFGSRAPSQPTPPMSPYTKSPGFFPPSTPLSARPRRPRDSDSSGWTDGGTLGGIRSANEELGQMINKHPDIQLGSPQSLKRPSSTIPWDHGVTSVETPMESKPGDLWSIHRRPFPKRKASLAQMPSQDDRRAGLVIYHDKNGEEAFRSFGVQFASDAITRMEADWPRVVNTVAEEPARGTDHMYPSPSRPSRAVSHRSSLSGGFHTLQRVNHAHKRASSIAESLVDPNPFPVGTSGPMTGFEPALERLDLPTTPAEPADFLHYTPMSSGNCVIDGSSSFHLRKGFCAGALEVLEGGIGVRKAKKQGGLSSTMIVARCKSCVFEVDFRQIELDLHKQDEGNFVNNGVGHRLRFLQKSHLPTKKVDEVAYGCIFCVRMGRTLDESDATVFTSTHALFRHLARHPRPLPEVPGIVIAERLDMLSGLRNNYDLHLENPPERHPVREVAGQIARLPTGVANQSVRKSSDASLEFIQGAKIVGLTWPARHHGEWCWGWHDGVYGAVATDMLTLDRPDWSRFPRGSTSRVRVRARWKYAPKEKGWLRFDKDEIITNITWPHAEHWCWAGTNARGKWGIFPQAFVETMEESGSVFEQKATLSARIWGRAQSVSSGETRAAAPFLNRRLW